MPRGGRRAGAGRKPGSTTKRTREIANGAVALGTTPLEYMLAVVHDPKATQERRDMMAVAAAPYVHPRLGAISKTVDGSISVSHKVVSFEVQPIPSDQFLTPEAIAQLSLTGPALMVNEEPVAVADVPDDVPA